MFAESGTNPVLSSTVAVLSLLASPSWFASSTFVDLVASSSFASSSMPSSNLVLSSTVAVLSLLASPSSTFVDSVASSY